MRWLIDNNLPRSLVTLLSERGHYAVHVATALSPDAPDEQVAAFARQEARVLVTRDRGFGDRRHFPPADFPGLVIMDLPETATAAAITRVMASLIEQPPILAALPGRLAIVEFGRVRLT